MRTQGSFFADTPHSGGVVVYGVGDVAGYGSFARTRNGLGDYSWNLAASLTAQVSVNLAQLKKLTTYPGLSGMPFQESTSGYPASSGMPPYTFTPPTGPPAKGIRINDITIVSLITGAALSAHTPSLNRVTYANNVANSVANIPLTGTLPTAIQANPYVTKLTVTTPGFEVTDNADLILDIVVTTIASGAYRLYAVVLHVDFNYN